MTTTTPETAASAPTVRAVRPFYWSVRRELWEHRSLYIAPLAAAGVVLFGFLISAMNLGHFRHAILSLPPEKRAVVAAIPYDFAAMAIIVTGLIVGVLYCLGALHNERRDRTILFWKSLPVSDLITVLSKATIPMAVIPAIAFVVILGLQLIMLAINAVVLLADGLGAPTAQLLLPQMTLVLVYGLVALALWFAPIWGWLLLISAWARRTPFLWAFLPPLALVVLEKIAFDTNYVGQLLIYRLGGFEQAFTVPHQGRHMTGLPEIDAARFLSNPDLWTGLGVAAAFLAAAVWVRRYREPI
jgi:ABC-2 type transport system permease protein